MVALPWAGIAVAGASLVLALIALVQARRANARVAEISPDIRGLAQRGLGKSAEEAFSAIFGQLEEVSRRMGDLQVEVTALDRMGTRSLRRVGLVRFDANEEIRGDLSFALCLLDNRGNGLVLSSVHNLNDCRIYLRGILNGKTQSQLMAEEQEALEQALGEP